MLLKKVGETQDGNAARLELRTGIEGWLDPSVDRDAPLREARDDHVGSLGEEAALRQLIQEGDSLEILIIRCYGPRLSTLSVSG